MSTRPLIAAVVALRFGWVAQLAEQRTDNPRVGGTRFRIYRRQCGASCASVLTLVPLIATCNPRHTSHLSHTRSVNITATCTARRVATNTPLTSPQAHPLVLRRDVLAPHTC